jgi:hypothetical protein
MKTKKHYKRHYKQTKKNKIKKQNVTRKYRNRGGARTTQAQRDARTAKTEAEVVKKYGAESLKVKRTKPLTKKQRDLEEKNAKAKETAAKVAVTFAIDDEFIPVVEEEAIKEANKYAPEVSPEKIVKKVLDFTSIIAESAKKAANSTLAIKNKFKAKPKQKQPPQQEQPPQQDIKVYDFISGDDISPSDFFEEHKDNNPFILVSMIENNQKKLYSGNAIGWDKGNNESVECKDDTPVGWQGNRYEKHYIKPGGRRFIKAYLGGAPIMLLKPSWFDSGKVPGDKFFTLVSAEPVFKYMSLELATGIDGNFDAQGANHCNQTGPQITYALEGEQNTHTTTTTTTTETTPAQIETTTETMAPAQLDTTTGNNQNIAKLGTKPIIVTKPGTKPIKITDPASIFQITSEDVTIAQSIEDEEERQRLEDEKKERQRLKDKETERQRLKDKEDEETERQRLKDEEDEETERQRLKDERQRQEQEQAKASSPKEKKVSTKKSPSARPPSPEYRYSSSSYNKPNSHALLAASRYKNYFFDASDKPNSYALLNSRRRLSGGGKSRHTSNTSRKQRIK